MRIRVDEGEEKNRGGEHKERRKEEKKKETKEQEKRRQKIVKEIQQHITFYAVSTFFLSNCPTFRDVPALPSFPLTRKLSARRWTRRTSPEAKLTPDYSKNYGVRRI